MTTPDGARADLETILVVEDDEELRKLTRRMLERRGYTVIEARNGLEALESIEKGGGPIHLVITDVVMPKMGGRQLVERLAETRPELPILYFSGYPAHAGFKRGIHGQIPLLQKPFSEAELLGLVRELLDGCPRPAPDGLPDP